MEKFVNSWKSAAKGLKTAACRWQFWVVFIPVFLLFVFIFNILSVGNNFLQLLIALPFLDKFSIILQVYQEFLFNFFSIEKALIFVAAVGQSMIVSTIVFLWSLRRKLDDKAILGSAGASLLALLGAGCPLCGGTILVPVLLGIFGASAFALVQSISFVVMLAAIIVIVIALKRLGFMCYMQPKNKGGKK